MTTESDSMGKHNAVEVIYLDCDREDMEIKGQSCGWKWSGVFGFMGDELKAEHLEQHNKSTKEKKEKQEEKAKEGDWSIVEIPDVERIARLAAEKVANKYGDVTTFDDCYQEALLHSATKADKVRKYLSDPHMGERSLHKWLEHRLVNGVETAHAHAAESISLQECLNFEDSMDDSW